MRAGKGLGVEGGCHVLMVLARWLFDNPTWFKSLKGPRIIVEHDAYLNFLPESPYFKCWTRLYRSCNFDMIISSGKETTHRLREDGLPAVWVPKGCNKEFLLVDNTFSRKMGYFASPIAEQETGKKFYFYKSRYEMAEELHSNISAVACTVAEFPSTLSGYSAVVTNDETMREPMAKHFECSALGCAVIRERREELADLGYVNHESVIMYDDWEEMRELCCFYKKRCNRLKLEDIQRKAREVTANQTWDHRAKQVFEFIKPWVKSRVFI